MARTSTPTDIARITERIRQERETFDQRQRQDSRWFVLKLVIGYSSVLLLAIILIFSIYVLTNYKNYSSTVVTSAGVALFVDILGVLASIWKIVLDQSPITKLEPITSIDE